MLTNLIKQTEIVQAHHLNAPVVCPHFILDPVIFEDVNRLQECEPVHVLRLFMTVAKEKEQLNNEKDIYDNISLTLLVYHVAA